MILSSKTKQNKTDFVEVILVIFWGCLKTLKLSGLAILQAMSSYMIEEGQNVEEGSCLIKVHKNKMISKVYNGI